MVFVSTLSFQAKVRVMVNESDDTEMSNIIIIIINRFV